MIALALLVVVALAVVAGRRAALRQWAARATEPDTPDESMWPTGPVGSIGPIGSSAAIRGLADGSPAPFPAAGTVPTGRVPGDAASSAGPSFSATPESRPRIVRQSSGRVRVLDAEELR